MVRFNWMHHRYDWPVHKYSGLRIDLFDVCFQCTSTGFCRNQFCLEKCRKALCIFVCRMMPDCAPWIEACWCRMLGSLERHGPLVVVQANCRGTYWAWCRAVAMLYAQTAWGAHGCLGGAAQSTVYPPVGRF